MPSAHENRLKFSQEEVYMRKIKFFPVVLAAMLTTSLFARSACAALPALRDIVNSTASDVPDAAEASETEPKHQSPMELAEGYYWYEGFFLDQEDVENAFRTVEENYPKYEYIPDLFHVTTQYKPDPKHESLYGTPVAIHIIGYVSGVVEDLEEDITSDNEGLLVEVTSSDEDMQALIDSIDKVWHITGSYSAAAKYTGHLDFSDAVPSDMTIEGIFGMADSDGKVTLQ